MFRIHPDIDRDIIRSCVENLRMEGVTFAIHLPPASRSAATSQERLLGPQRTRMGHTPTDYRVVVAGEYSSAISRAFDFYRHHGDGRYSDSSLMRLTSWADGWNFERRDERLEYPAVITASTALSFDPLTEIKSGGLCGMLTWNAGSGYIMIATAQTARRRRLGSTLITLALGCIETTGRPMRFAVGRQNNVGRMFLDSNSLLPSSMGPRQSITYAWDGNDADEAVA